MAKGIALTIGLNSIDPAFYGGPNRLSGCHNDANQLAALARQLGFTVQAVLLSQQGTRKAVIDHVLAAAKKLDPGDIFLLHYSGHGTQASDSTSSSNPVARDEPDRRDEAWCLYDGLFLDDELRRLWAHFKDGVRIVALSDSCHSGTMIKDIQASFEETARSIDPADEDTPVGIRELPNETADAAVASHADFYKPLFENLKSRPLADSDILASVIFISGCRDNETSKDLGKNGAFTRALLECFRSGSFAGNYKQLCDQIASKIARTYAQNPQINSINAAKSISFGTSNAFSI